MLGLEMDGELATPTLEVVEEDLLGVALRCARRFGQGTIFP